MDVRNGFFKYLPKTQVAAFLVGVLLVFGVSQAIGAEQNPLVPPQHELRSAHEFVSCVVNRPAKSYDDALNLQVTLVLSNGQSFGDDTKQESPYLFSFFDSLLPAHLVYTQTTSSGL